MLERIAALQYKLIIYSINNGFINDVALWTLQIQSSMNILILQKIVFFILSVIAFWGSRMFQSSKFQNILNIFELL